MSALADLPDDVREIIAPHAAEGSDTLDAIGLSIAQKRDDAKTARTSSGVEQTWIRCEESYAGIDDANRGEFQGVRWSKPMSPDGPVTTGRPPPRTDHKSTAFVPLTARYVDAGAAKVGEILLPIDDKAFALTETPIPRLVEGREDESQVVLDHMGGIPAMRAAKPGEIIPPTAGAPPMAPPVAPGMAPAMAAAAPPAAALPPGAVAPPAAAGAAVVPPGMPAQPAAPPQVPLTVKDLAEEAIQTARKKAKKAERRIYDWMVECQHQAEVRKVIFDAARIGVGVLKGPFPKASRAVMTQRRKDSLDIVIEEKVAPATAWVDPWNVFPDPACGENIHNGSYIFERDYLSEKQVRDLKKLPGYIGRQIDRVLEEGAKKEESKDNEARTSVQTKGRYETWYYYGTLSRDEMECIATTSGKPLDKDEVPKDQPQVYAIVTMIGDCVIRASLNPLDSGSFPYHSVPWRRRVGSWAGVGVSEQLYMPQRLVNSATRAMLNNAGKSAGTQIVIDRSAIVPADGQYTVTPDKIWYKTGEDTPQDVRASFMAIEIPNVTEQLMVVINYAMRLAEESTSIPLVTQGQSGATTPDTFGAAQLQNNNANQLLRSIGYTFDDFITEPVVRMFYEWLLMDPDVPEEEKGDFKIEAHGSAALVERAIQDQTIAQMAPIVVDPRYELDPAEWAKLYLKSKRIDPRELHLSDEKKAEAAAAAPPKAPQVQAAEIRAATEDKRLAQQQQVDAKELELEEQDMLSDRTVWLHELQMKRELAMMDYANRNNISLAQAQAQLAKTAMTLKVQKELAGTRPVRGGRPQVAAPMTEPPGRAEPGRAFEQ